MGLPWYIAVTMPAFVVVLVALLWGTAWMVQASVQLIKELASDREWRQAAHATGEIVLTFLILIALAIACSLFWGIGWIYAGVYAYKAYQRGQGML